MQVFFLWCLQDFRLQKINSKSNSHDYSEITNLKSTNTHFHYSDLSLTLFWITHWAYILDLSADKLHKGHTRLKSEIRDKSGCVSPASISNYMHLLIHNRFMVWLALKFLSVKCQIETITMDKIRLLQHLKSKSKKVPRSKIG